MIQLKQIYKCPICGNIVEILHAGRGELVCCGKPMELMIEKTEDQGKEKHVPILKNIRGGVKILVGVVFHPMDKEHYIEWIEITVNGKSYRQFLHPGEKPEAEFKVKVGRKEKVIAREYCNLHGLWKAEW